MKPAPGVAEWLLEGDPSIRWQVQRDLLDAPEKVWQAERRRVATEGWGAQLLQHQGPDGRWGHGIYSPKWTSTTYTLLLLRDLGLPPGHPSAAPGCKLILDRCLSPLGRGGRQRKLGDIMCTCVLGMWVTLPAYFDAHCGHPRLPEVIDHLLLEQMPDGGWNCRRRFGAVHSSVHTTLNVLDGVAEAMARGLGPRAKLRAAQSRAIEFLLMHRLFKSDKTGDVIHESFTRFSFPPRWHYDVLRGLDYIRTTRAIRDPRLDDAFELLERRRDKTDRWKLQNRHRGETFFEMEKVGQPSRWNTLRALRCLKCRDA
jgi:hypothetical protein